MPAATGTGFFGKMPAVGDFTHRGLPPAFRQWLDGWITRHLVAGLPTDGRWPGEGLRFSLARDGIGAAGLILPSDDRAGREYPLAAMLLTGGAAPEPASAEPWIEAALEPLWDAVEGKTGPDDLAAALAAIPVPVLAAGTLPLCLWSDVVPPLAADPEDPGEAVARVLAGRPPDLSSG